MSRTRRPARPAPPPKTDTARRLEYVRTESGYPSLRSFWRRIVEGWENEDGSPAVSYEAVRGYHYDREPPAAYLVRVGDVFGFRLEYLLTGREPARAPRTAGEWMAQWREPPDHDLGPVPADLLEADKTISKLFTDLFRGEAEVIKDAAGVERIHSGPGGIAHAQLWRALAPLHSALANDARLSGAELAAESEIWIEAAKRLSEAVLAPLSVLDALPPEQTRRGLGHPSRMSFEAGVRGYQLESYIIGMCELLLPILQRQSNGLMRRVLATMNETEEAEDDDGEA